MNRKQAKQNQRRSRKDRNTSCTQCKTASRKMFLEPMEPRLLMAADIEIGAVYVEEDLGSDAHGDLFYITFQGGAAGTELTELSIDGDLNRDGFSLGDLFFDTQESGLGADHAFAFQVETLDTQNPNATVRATVQDGSTRLTLNFTNFVAGDSLVFSIDVDEVQFYDPNETDLDTINDSFDPITSGVEFQNSHLEAKFTAPHYHDIDGEARFRNRYDDWIDQTGLPIPRDDQDGKRDRTAGAGFALQQQPKPVSLSGIVYLDIDEDLQLDTTDQRLQDVELSLYRLVGSSFVETGHRTRTDANGSYSFGLNLELEPGVYQVRETQPSGYFSVGATIGRIGSTPVGQTVSGNPDILTQIEILEGDTHATDLNFAEALPNSISGHVCVVTDGFDCFSDESTKEGLANVLIELRDETGTLVTTTRTDSNGFYRFDNLRAGTFSITEVTPQQLLEGAARLGSLGGVIDNASLISQVVVGGGVQAVNYDFCELEPSEISGTTYFDVNNNGRRDTGEAPIAGVRVAIRDSAGTIIDEARTDANGFYSFTNLRPDTYQLVEETPIDYAPGQATAGTIGGRTVGATDSTGDLIRSIRLPAGSQGIHYDFGEIRTGSISGHVFSDSNGDCFFDAASDLSLSGVRVELLNESGEVIQSLATDAQGRYQFDDLLPGTYSVREIQPTGFFHGGQVAGSGGGNDSIDDLISSIILVGGEEFVEYNFCEIEPSSLTGSVFVDEDGDCLVDPGERGLADVRVELLDETGTVIDSTVTDSSGRYSFTNLEPGRYSVREIQPTGFYHGGQRAGTGGGDDSQADVIRAIDLAIGTDLSEYNFCELEPGSISGSVFADLDFDCVQDPNEESLENIVVELLNSAGEVVSTTVTNAQGNYTFANLRPGTYSVREVQPDDYFHGGQTGPEGVDATVDDLIGNISVGSGQSITDVDFCEVPPATISGYVYQDGEVIITNDGQPPENLREVRDGMRTDDDAPISNVTLELRTLTGAQIESFRALPGIYSEQFITVDTDSNGYFEFTGLRAGAYHIYQRQPDGFLDGLDTPGTTGGTALNKEDPSPEDLLTLIQLSNPGADPGTDAILAVAIEPGQRSFENNFSEIIVDQETPFPPDPPVVSDPPPTTPAPPTTFPTQPFLAATPPLRWTPTPIYIGVGLPSTPTWHLSVINGGFPRGSRSGEPVDEETVDRKADRLNVYAWSIEGMSDKHIHHVSLNPNPSRAERVERRKVFDLPGAKPLVGDFNGDGYDELALFLDGEWFIDLNANGRWDEADMWVKLGTVGDQPVVGDWDGDGKDDVGIYGEKWEGDERALAKEPGLPDPENLVRMKPKNVPPTRDEAPEEPRILKPNATTAARAHVIDHVFQFGGGNDKAISGDFNGDEIATIGIFRDGLWILDINGDGRVSDSDRQVEFGRPGDLPIVGDFNGDGVDELAIIRGNQVIVDSNANGRIDATDQVFLLESADGTVIVGDFNGDGVDEPVLHQTAYQRTLQARREAG